LVNNLNEQIQKVNKKIEQTHCSGDADKIQKIKEQNLMKQNLEKQKSSVLIEMGCRYRACRDIIEETSNVPLKEKMNTKLNDLKNDSDRALLRADDPCTARDIRVNNLIQKAATKRYTTAKVNLPFKLLSFVGMTFAATASIAALFGLAAPPIGIAIAATIICTVVAAYYLTKFGYIASNYKENQKNAIELENCKATFFKKPVSPFSPSEKTEENLPIRRKLSLT
jgi:hypothetical protein